MNRDKSSMGFFERHLTLWVALCIVPGIALGKVAPGVAQALDGMALYVNDAPVVSIPIAICLFFMMYPIMVKIDFDEVAIATAVMLFGLSSGAALATVVACSSKCR